MLTPWQQSYNRVDGDLTEDDRSESTICLEEKHTQVKTYRSITLSPRNILYLSLAFGGSILLAVLLTYGCANLAISPSQPSRRSDHGHKTLCGKSSAEAISLGCTFDQMTWSWYPPHCPHYANDEFIAVEDWRFYENWNSTEAVTGEKWTQALDNELDLWGERREHLTHCVYMFLSVGQILRDETAYSTKLSEYEHLAHCSEVVLESMRKDPDWYKIETFVGKVSYGQSCER